MTTRLRPQMTSRMGGGLGLLLLIGLVVGVAALVRSATGGPGSEFRTTVDALEVMTVTDVLAARAKGGLQRETIALGGYWSNGAFGHSCAPPESQPGELELYCVDHEFGITELDEPIFVVDRHGYATTARGPNLTPWFPNELEGLEALFGLPIINDQRYPPVPIIVIGHFDDARAAACRPAARQVCLDRLVVDRIHDFDPDAVPTPGITPSPTPFPSPHPPGLFGPAECGGDVDYSFEGWTTTSELGLPFEREGHVWAMVTAVPVLLGGEEWNDDPGGSGVRWRWWGNRICIAEEGSSGSMEFGHVPGTSYREWEDGRTTPGEP